MDGYYHHHIRIMYGLYLTDPKIKYFREFYTNIFQSTPFKYLITSDSLVKLYPQHVVESVDRMVENEWSYVKEKYSDLVESANLQKPNFDLKYYENQ